MMRFTLFIPALFSVLASLLLTAPAQAQNRSDLYTVSDIHVDVTAKSSTEAFTTAIAGGRPKAFQILYRRLTQQKDWAREPNLDAGGLLRISRGYNVANERRSTTRYVADVTYIFNSEAVSRLLHAAGIGFTSQTPSQHILIIPMSPNVSGGAWAQALAAPAAQQAAMVPFSLPGADDLRALASLNLDTASWADVAAAAGRAHASGAALVQAIYAKGKVTVNIRVLGPAQAPAKVSLDVPMQGTVGTAYPAAAQAALGAIDDLWKSHVTIDPGQRGRITADMRIASLEQWGEAQAALASVPLVSGVTLMAMDTGYARLSIGYTGTQDQLREALGAAHLTLTNRGGQWLLASGS